MKLNRDFKEWFEGEYGTDNNVAIAMMTPMKYAWDAALASVAPEEAFKPGVEQTNNPQVIIDCRIGEGCRFPDCTCPSRSVPRSWRDRGWENNG